MSTESAISRCHAEIRCKLTPDTPVVILHIGMEQTVVLAETPGQKPVSRTLTIGSDKTAQEYFRHDPPTPLEIEQAIAAVEEEVMPLRAFIADGSMLYTADPETRRMAAFSGADGAELSVEGVEALFNRLAAVSLGQPAAQESLPLDKRIYSSTLILREFMHHLGFVSAVMCGDR